MASSPLPKIRVGVAIITRNRPELLLRCVQSVVHHASGNRVSISVFDDGSDPGLSVSPEQLPVGVEILRSEARKGVVFNKNRALYYFTKVKPAKFIILLEDDMEVTSGSWLHAWIGACRRYGHVNFVPPWFFNESHSKYYLGGEGSSEDPYRFGVVTGQCSAVRRSIVNKKAGYLNPRFVGYGHGHVEWTNRIVQSGYGGVFASGRFSYYGLSEGLRALDSVTNKDPSELARNSRLFKALKGDAQLSQVVRRPWLSPKTREVFMASMSSVFYGSQERRPC